MVVPGHAAAIPAPAPLPGRVAETEGRHSTKADRWCSISFGALVPYGTRAPRRVAQRGDMAADTPLNDHLDDDDYPAYTMGRAAEMLGTTPGFLRAIGEARLITPLRSEGGHRRYSRYQLRIAARARELVDRGTPIEAACRIVILADQLEEAQRINAEYRRAANEAPGGSRPGPD
jgi:hypothetical protein